MSSPNIGSTGDHLSTSPNSSQLANANRKRLGPAAPVYSPNETLNQMTQEAEQRHQDKYVVQKEMRAIRAREMEKQRKEDEEREKVEGESSSSRFSRPPSSNSYNNGHSLPPTSSLPPTKQRMYSSNRVEDLTATTTTSSEDNPRELKKKINEMEEKFKKHAIYQTQLENDNQKLIYEVDLLKDLIEEHQELIIELRRQFKEKARELDCQKRANKDLQTDFARLKDILKQRDALIEDSGLVLYTDYDTTTVKPSQQQGAQKKPPTPGSSSKVSGDTPLSEMKSVLPAVLVGPETAKLLDQMGEGTIDDKLRRLFAEKQELKELNSKIMAELEDERDKRCELEKKLIASTHKVLDSQESNQELQDIQRQYTKEINELKMKIQKLDHENIIIKQDKQRLDTQLKYLQTNFDELENTERRLIKEKRDAQRELNESRMLVNDLQLKIEVLQKTLEKKRQTSKYIDTMGSGSSSTSASTAATTASSYASNSSTSLNSLSSTSLLATSSNLTTPGTSSTTLTMMNALSHVPGTPTSSSSSDPNSQSSSRKNSTTLIENGDMKSSASSSSATNSASATTTATTESSSSPTISSPGNTSSSSSSSSPASSSNNQNNHTLDDLTTTPTKKELFMERETVS